MKSKLHYALSCVGLLYGGGAFADFQCDGSTYSDGLCCNDIWYHPEYQNLMGACPNEVFYVDGENPTASNDNPGTEQAPWFSIQKAAADLQAGQVAIVKAGTYRAAGTGFRYTPALNPANSGRERIGISTHKINLFRDISQRAEWEMRSVTEMKDQIFTMPLRNE